MKKLATIITLCLAGMLLACVAVIGCARAGGIKLAWTPNPAAEQVTDYRVWKGIDCIATVPAADACATLVLPAEPCVLTVTARNVVGESAHSAPLRLVVVTMEESTDLKTWAAVGTIHREKKAAAFYRLKVETEGAP